MPTKFVVLWLQTIFRVIEDDYLELHSENFPFLEEAWQAYNKLCANDENQQVMILVPLKDFNRSSK